MLSSEMSTSNYDSESLEPIPDTEGSALPQLPPEDSVANPSDANKLIVKVYGLIGHTRCIDLQFESEHLIPESVFIFEGKRYKIASIIKMTDNQTAINAVAVEYGT